MLQNVFPSLVLAMDGETVPTSGTGHGPRWWRRATERHRRSGADEDSAGLDALIGRTRAAALAAIADGGCTTTELAARIGTSASTASQHATVLREGGLIHSRRDGNRMLHTVNRLGHDLLAVPGEPLDGLGR